MCRQQRLKLACASSQSDQGICCPHKKCSMGYTKCAKVRMYVCFFFFCFFFFFFWSCCSIVRLHVRFCTILSVSSTNDVLWSFINGIPKWTWCNFQINNDSNPQFSLNIPPHAYICASKTRNIGYAMPKVFVLNKHLIPLNFCIHPLYNGWKSSGVADIM